VPVLRFSATRNLGDEKAVVGLAKHPLVDGFLGESNLAVMKSTPGEGNGIEDFETGNPCNRARRAAQHR